MAFERDTNYQMIQAQEVLREHNVPALDVQVYDFAGETRAMVEQPSDGVDPLYTLGTAIMQQHESKETAAIRAVGNAVHPEKASQTMLLRHETNQESGEVVLVALGPQMDVFVYKSTTLKSAAVDLFMAVSLK